MLQALARAAHCLIRKHVTVDASIRARRFSRSHSNRIGANSGSFMVTICSQARDGAPCRGGRAPRGRSGPPSQRLGWRGRWRAHPRRDPFAASSETRRRSGSSASAARISCAETGRMSGTGLWRGRPRGATGQVSPTWGRRPSECAGCQGPTRSTSLE